MSFGIIRIQKFQGSAIRGIQSHDLREKTPRTNPDIDSSRTNQNYSLLSSTDYNNSVSSKIKSLELKKSVRKDAVRMVQCLVTSDCEFFKKLTPEKQSEFFSESLNFIKHRYGEKNIFSATVHLDEKTPHMHINFVPITNDGKLSAKSIFTRSEFSNLHTDFHNDIGKKWGLERGQSHEEKRHHVTTEELKIKTRRAEIEKSITELQLSVQLKYIQPDDIKPQQLDSKMLGLISHVESPEMIIHRINEKYIEPIRKKLQGAVFLSEKFDKLEVNYKNSELKNLELQKKVEQFEHFFSEINNCQPQNIKAKIAEFINENKEEVRVFERMNKEFSKDIKNIAERKRFVNEFMRRWKLEPKEKRLEYEERIVKNIQSRIEKKQQEKASVKSHNNEGMSR
jgi:hypothetical protein